MVSCCFIKLGSHFSASCYSDFTVSHGNLEYSSSFSVKVSSEPIMWMDSETSPGAGSSLCFQEVAAVRAPSGSEAPALCLRLGFSGAWG